MENRIERDQILKLHEVAKSHRLSNPHCSFRGNQQEHRREYDADHYNQSACWPAHLLEPIQLTCLPVGLLRGHSSV